MAGSLFTYCMGSWRAAAILSPSLLPLRAALRFTGNMLLLCAIRCSLDRLQLRLEPSVQFRLGAACASGGIVRERIRSGNAAPLTTCERGRLLVRWLSARGSCRRWRGCQGGGGRWGIPRPDCWRGTSVAARLGGGSRLGAIAPRGNRGGRWRDSRQSS